MLKQKTFKTLRSIKKINASSHINHGTFQISNSIILILPIIGRKINSNCEVRTALIDGQK